MSEDWTVSDGLETPTATLPFNAPLGTFTTICVADWLTKDVTAGTLRKTTEVTTSNPVPVIVRSWPGSIGLGRKPGNGRQHDI
jgi:hypothetical protein